MPDDDLTPVEVSGGTKASKWLSISAVAVVFISAVWLLSWALITRELGNPKMPGDFGDMFGAVNAWFSGLAFAGIIVAILIQREDLILQQKELTESRKAQEGQVKALTLTAKINANTALLENQQVQFRSSEYYSDVPEATEEWLQERMAIIIRSLEELDSI